MTESGDLVVDPAAGSFIVMQAARALGRNFVGCDIAFAGNADDFDSTRDIWNGVSVCYETIRERARLGGQMWSPPASTATTAAPKRR